MITPALRCLKIQLHSTLHVICKDQYAPVLMHNPHIEKIHTLQEDWKGMIGQLKNEGYDLLIDLQKTMRSYRMRGALNIPTISYNKSTVEHKLYLMLPSYDFEVIHFIDRVFSSLKALTVYNDGKGMEVKLDDASEQKVANIIKEINLIDGYTAVVIGGSHVTKRVPSDLISDYINSTSENIVLLGGKDSLNESRLIMSQLNRYVHNGVGQYSLLESFTFIKNSDLVITGDTGMMHYAASENKEMIVIYGSTSPVFGMYPYYRDEVSGTAKYLKSKQLSCWPCSKAGRPSCPKSHMNCLNQWTAQDIISLINN